MITPEEKLAEIDKLHSQRGFLPYTYAEWLIQRVKQLEVLVITYAEYPDDATKAMTMHPAGIEIDPTRWCYGCMAKTAKECKCGPIAENE